MENQSTMLKLTIVGCKSIRSLYLECFEGDLKGATQTEEDLRRSPLASLDCECGGTKRLLVKRLYGPQAIKAFRKTYTRPLSKVYQVTEFGVPIRKLPPRKCRLRRTLVSKWTFQRMMLEELLYLKGKLPERRRA